MRAAAWAVAHVASLALIVLGFWWRSWWMVALGCAIFVLYPDEA